MSRRSCYDSPGSCSAIHCRYRRCRGYSFGKSLRIPADLIDVVDLSVAVVDLAVADVVAAAVGVAAAADRTSSGIPFVLLFHTDRVHLVDAGVVADDSGGCCNGRWCDSKTLTAQVFGRAALIHYCISLPTAIPPFVILSHQISPG